MTYPFPWDLFLQLAADLPAGRRSLPDDARVMRSRMQPPPAVIGIETIPRHGAVVIAANHYQRRDLWIGWPGAVITAAVADRRCGESVHWLVTGGLRFCRPGGAGGEIPLSRLLLERVAQTYDLTALPLADDRARARAVRSWLHRAKDAKVLGIFPEGLTGRSDRLSPPEDGFEPLCRLLARQRIPILPTAITEEEGRLVVRFDGARLLPCAADVMHSIAALLPDRQRGPYGGK